MKGLTTDMAYEEALHKHNQLKTLASFARTLLLEMRERKGWAVLGFASFEEYGEKEWGYSRTYINRLADAEAIQKSLSVPIGTEIPESQLRPLGKIPDYERQAVFDEAKRIAAEENKALTAKLVEEAVADYKLKNEQLKDGLNGLLDDMDDRAEKIAAEKLEREKEKLQANVDQIALQLESDYAARVDSQSDVILRLRNELALLKESTATKSPALSSGEITKLEEKIQALNDDIERLTKVKNDTHRLQNINTQYKFFAKTAITTVTELMGHIDAFKSVDGDAKIDGIKVAELLDDGTKRILTEALSVLRSAKGQFCFMLTNSTADYGQY